MLRRVFGRPASTEPPEIAARWEELRRAEPELADGIELERTVQALQRGADLSASPQQLDSGQVRDRLAAGIPLLHGAHGWLDSSRAMELFWRLADKAVRGEAISEAKQLREQAERGELPLQEAADAACALDNAAVAEILSAAGEAMPLANVLLQRALAPGFHAAAVQYEPLRIDVPWGRGVCPVCGGLPALGELRGGESRRVLRCGRCGSGWDFQRLRCVYCDTRDHKQLNFLHASGQSDTLCIDTCDTCGSYIKSLARLDPIPYELLTAEDLATAPLDLLAIERGFTRGDGRL